MSDAAAVNAQLRRAVHLAELGRPGDAVPLVQRVLASEPGNLTALQVLADCLLHADRFEEILGKQDDKDEE